MNQMYLNFIVLKNEADKEKQELFMAKSNIFLTI